MRILIFHGYLLGGTGSNVYNARMAEALAGQGHDVHLFSQDPAPEGHHFVDAIGDWDTGPLRVRAVRKPRRVTVYRPDIGSLLPVYVHDRYQGFEVRTFGECNPEEVEAYIARNVAAVAEVADAAGIDVALANHLIMGPVILARALGRRPYAVKVHGSALEYSVKAAPARFLPYAREGLAPARGVLVGSRHTAESLWRAIGDDGLPARTRLGPPGVDVGKFTPREPAPAAAGLRRLAGRLAAAAPAGGPADGFALDAPAAGRALAGLDPGVDRIVTFTGKLIVSKGVDLLLAAWPLVLDRVPAARLVVVGFGAYRAGLEQIVAALAAGDLARLRGLAERGRELEGGGPGPLRMLLAFLAGLDAGATRHYAAACARTAGTVTFTGRLEHDDLAELLPACEAQVVASTFPEAFGMVAAEAAACGVLPISADHSGLAEVTGRLARAVPPEVATWLSFGLGPSAVPALAGNLIAWLEAPRDLRERTRAALAAAAHEAYSWEGVAAGMLAAAQGRLDGLSRP